jgi:MYXO-CTERM domain-containing protein
MGGPPDDQIEAQLQVVPADPDQPTGSDNPTDPTMGGENAGGCSVGGGGAGVLLLIALVPLRRRRR